MDLNKTFLYCTEFVNDWAGHWKIYDHGHLLLSLPPGKSQTVEQFHNRTDWSRWLKVVKTAKGEIVLTESSAWKSPWPELGLHEIDLINESGAEEESVKVLTPNPAISGAGEYVTCYLGVPKRIPVDLWDPLIKYSAIIWRRQLVKKQIEGTTYVRDVYRVVKEYVPRKKSELKAILKERQAIEEEKMRKARVKMLDDQEKLLMGAKGEDDDGR